MKQIAQQLRTQLMTLVTAGVAGLSLATAAAAAEVSAGANTNVGAQAGGTADAHMSTSGSANSNAPWQSGSTQGADRAADRMSTYGAEMKQSGGANLEATGKAAVKGKR